MNRQIEMIKKPAVNVILAAGFILVSFVIVTPFLAERHFDTAEKLIGKFKWPAAEEQFEAAMKIDPFNAEYPARYGLFLLNKAKYADNKTPLYKRSEELYRRALELYPGSAESWARLGQVYVGLAVEGESGSRGQGAGFRAQGTGYSINIGKAFECFAKAVECDPNGFNINYIAGYTGIQVWELLDDKEKEFVIERLKRGLKQRPWLSRKINRMISDKTKNEK